jgi:hypothetical protein
MASAQIIIQPTLIIHEAAPEVIEHQDDVDQEEYEFILENTN